MTPVASSPIVVRPARIADAAAILAITVDVVAEDVAFALRPDEVDRDPTRIAARIGAASTPARAFLVAVRGDEIVGWLEARAESPARRSHRAELVLAVARAQRRRGAATALLHEARRWAPDHGIEALRVTVRASNRAALSLYAAAGYVEEARLPKAIALGDARYEDAIVLALWLP